MSNSTSNKMPTRMVIGSLDEDHNAKHLSKIQSSRTLQSIDEKNIINTSDTWKNSDTDSDEDQNYTGLHKLCSLGEGEDDPIWENVLLYLQGCGNYSQELLRYVVEKEEKGVIPLFIACERQPPVKVVKALIEASPQTLTFRDEQDFRALHTACSNDASEEVIHLLVNKDPNPLGAKEALTGAHTTPLHLLMYENYSNPPSLAIFRLLATPGVMEVKDHFGNTPFQLFCQCVMRIQWSDKSPEKDAAKKHCQNIFHLYLEMHPRGKKHLLFEMTKFPDWLMESFLPHSHLKRILNSWISQKTFTFFIMLDLLNQIMIIVTFFHAMTTIVNDVRYTKELLSHKIILSIGVVVLILQKIVSWFFSFSHRSRIMSIWNQINIFQIAFIITSITRLSHFSLSNGVHDDQILYTLTAAIIWIELIARLSRTFLTISIFWTNTLHVSKKWILQIQCIRHFFIHFHLSYLSYILQTFKLLRSLIPFIVIGLCILTLFAQMTFIAMKTSKDSIDWCEQNNSTDVLFCSLNGSFIRAYNMLVGDVEIKDDEYKYSHIFSPIFAIVMLFLSLSVLTSLLNKSFTHQIREGKNAFWYHRLKFVSEILYAYSFMHKLITAKENNLKEETNGMCGRVVDVSLNRESSSRVFESEREDANTSAIFWDIMVSALVSYDNPYKVRKLPDVNERSFFRLLMTLPMFIRKFISLSVLPLWLILGFLTLGWLWPPQIREYLFCRNLSEVGEEDILNGEESLQKMNNHISTLENEVKDLKIDVLKMRNEILSQMVAMRQLLVGFNNTQTAKGQILT